uniref:Uncharacterized protein n=1 Tax=Rhinolophus ferrumequinum TaxID=59479 RepID=A0A671FUI4_RHIFE
LGPACMLKKSCWSLPAFKFCDQVCGLAICPTPASGWGLGKALVQSGHEETSLWLSL